jgi:nanoRNase/pAp phosphatase (c-di-AMP/oligoRNAs hydrolase)
VARNGTILKKPLRQPSLATVGSKFGAPLGKRFTRHNMPLLTLAHLAYTGLKRSSGAIRGRGANIFTQWAGDPDALGSAVVLRQILVSLGAKEVRILTGTLGHPQNRGMVQEVGIELHNPNKGRLPRGLNCMVDTSPPLGMTNTGGVLPAKEFFFVADHHADPEVVEKNCREHGVREVKLAFVGIPVGSTSSFMAALAMAFDVIDDLGPRGRAAAALGIYTDTSALLHGATPLDFRMFEKLTRDDATKQVLDELRDYRVPIEWNSYRSTAFLNVMSVGGVRIAPVGFVRAEHRDVVAELANDLMRIEGTSIGVVIGFTEKGTEVSVRADSRLLGPDQPRIVRVIDYLLRHAFPGVSGFKYERRPPHHVEGGASVPHTDKEMALFTEGWANAQAEAFLEHCRDYARALIAALKQLKATHPNEIQGLI